MTLTALEICMIVIQLALCMQLGNLVFSLVICIQPLFFPPSPPLPPPPPPLPLLDFKSLAWVQSFFLSLVFFSSLPFSLDLHFFFSFYCPPLISSSPFLMHSFLFFVIFSHSFSFFFTSCFPLSAAFFSRSSLS